MRRSDLSRRLAVVTAVLSTLWAAPALADEDVPASPRVWEIGNFTATGPDKTFQIGAGMHTWWNDYLLIGARVLGSSSRGTDDLSGDGVDDFEASEYGPHFEAQIDLGWPLYWRMRSQLAIVSRGEKRTVDETVYFGEVTQIQVVSGARALLSTDMHAAIPLGLRWSKHVVVSTDYGAAYREKWVQVRALWFAPDNAIGVDAEVLWMPVRVFAIGLYAEAIPMLGVPDDRERNCTTLVTRQTCSPLIDPSGFNVIPERANIRIGLRARLAFAK
jgi:hypothetical protein